MPNPNWKPGISGNPRGRPPGQRALTEILRKAGNKTIPTGDNRKVSRKRILADMAWNLATTGKATFPNGEELMLDPADWWNVVKFIYQHIDGPPRQDLDITTGGEALCIVIRGPADEDQPGNL